MAKPVSLPVWDEQELNSAQPDSTRQDQGWLVVNGVPEKPPVEYFNWWQNNVYKWIKEINTRGVLQYSGDVDYVPNLSVVTASDGFLYRCVQANGPSSTVIDPVDDDLSEYWQNASGQPVFNAAGGDTLKPMRVNWVGQTATYFLPKANSVNVDGYIVIELPDLNAQSTPTIQVQPGDTIISADGGSLSYDTAIVFNTFSSISIRLNSDGGTFWLL